MIKYTTSQKCRTLPEFAEPVDNRELFIEREEQGINQNQRQTIIKILRDGHIHFPEEFTRAGILQYNARIKELRDGKEGIFYDIPCQRIATNGKTFFYLRGWKGE